MHALGIVKLSIGENSEVYKMPCMKDKHRKESKQAN